MKVLKIIVLNMEPRLNLSSTVNEVDDRKKYRRECWISHSLVVG